MSDIERWLEHYIKGVQFPEASGFEVLELLDVRSKVAEREIELAEVQKVQLEEADRCFLQHAVPFYRSVAVLGDPKTLRKRAAVPCSHWWWYLERLARSEPIQAQAMA